MSEIVLPGSATDDDLAVHIPAFTEVDERIESAAAEISELDELWEHDWHVDEARAFARQDIDTATLPQHSLADQRLRRALDITISLVALILFAPLLLILAIAVRLTSPGPAIFTQLRAGAGGREFRMCKFRSMADGTDSALLADDAARRRYEQNGFKLDGNDPRITPLGRFMRKTSLDELPQLWNVLRGDMSIVGIRPLLTRELAMRPVADQMLIKMMRPGMTGLWQVEGRSTVGIDDRFALDRQYVQQWSVAMDLKIMVRTPLAVLRLGNAH